MVRTQRRVKRGGNKGVTVPRKEVAVDPEEREHDRKACKDPKGCHCACWICIRFQHDD
jgi:hypothetical protein